MKTLYSTLTNLLVLLFFVTACKKENTQKTTDAEIPEIATDSIDEGPVLLGSYDINVLKTEPYNRWLTEGYNYYEPDAEVLEKIKPYLTDSIHIRLFMGTWCEDSRREVPNLLKILDQLSYARAELKTVMLDSFYQTPDGLEKGFDIIKVPTVIFYKDTTEINRIVELPIETLEKDMFNILSGQFYRHAYDF